MHIDSLKVCNTLAAKPCSNSFAQLDLAEQNVIILHEGCGGHDFMKNCTKLI